jgi:hypothetical protein
VRLGGDLRDKLLFEDEANTGTVRPEAWKQAVVVSAAVAETRSALVEGDSRNDDGVDALRIEQLDCVGGLRQPERSPNELSLVSRIRRAPQATQLAGRLQ